MCIRSEMILFKIILDFFNEIVEIFANRVARGSGITNIRSLNLRNIKIEFRVFVFIVLYK